MKNSALSHQGSISPKVLVLALIIVVATLGLVVFVQSNYFPNMTQTTTDLLPPVNQRINPDSLNPNKLVIRDVNPGASVTIEEVTIESDSFVVVFSDMSGTRTEIGRSSLLTSGTHQSVMVTTSSLEDGDVIYVSLQTKDGNEVKDENGNMIEIQKNVGMVMSHYESEY